MNVKYLPSPVEVPVGTFTSNLEQRTQKMQTKESRKVIIVKQRRTA